MIRFAVWVFSDKAACWGSCMANLGYSDLAALPFGRKKRFLCGLSCPLSLHFSWHLFKYKYTKIFKCMWGGEQGVCMGIWEILRVALLNYLQINNLLFILNWKIYYDLFIRKFMLRHIFALKIIKSSPGNCKGDNMRISKGYTIKSGKMS